MSPVQTADLPEDVLVIHYTALGPDSPQFVRLQALAAIGRLLTAQGQGHTLDDLCEEEQARMVLRAWLESEEASRFWQLEGDQVVPVVTCEKHILVGTRHLLDDLAALPSQPPRYRPSDLDVLWRAASIFVDQHFGQEDGLHGVKNGQ